MQFLKIIIDKSTKCSVWSLFNVKRPFFFQNLNNNLQYRCRLVLITNRKLHTVLRLVPRSVTLNDLQRRNSSLFFVISSNSIALQADYARVIEDRPIMSAECRISTFGRI